eukprot:2774520-Amphidinium_carterae.1
MGPSKSRSRFKTALLSIGHCAPLKLSAHFSRRHPAGTVHGEPVWSVWPLLCRRLELLQEQGRGRQEEVWVPYRRQ